MLLQKLTYRNNSIKITHFVLIISILNFLFFHWAFFNFVFQNLEYASLNGILLIISLVIAMLVANFFVFYLFLSISRRLGKTLLITFFLLNAVSVYFVNTYHVIIDESMIGNIFNTNYEESSSFFSFKAIIYLVCLGIIPSIFILKAKIEKDSIKQFAIKIFSTLLFLIILVFINASNWLWIDKNSKQLGGLAMPWSYTVNTVLFFVHENQQNEKEILLPDAHIKNQEKSVVVLVIGESARRENFSLYGYPKNTNPLLSKEKDIKYFKAVSCATYTTAGVKCILEHEDTSKLYEILPNYLYRTGVDVVWRTTNWGEPPVHIADEKYMNKQKLASIYKGENNEYDEILLTGLKEQIENSTKDKILIILHTSTSHGPTYNKKYPPEFEKFKPVCNSVELGNCSHNELMNAYDNTIVYTDYLLHSVIEKLKELTNYKSAMIYVSDHGESLGEKNLYMHGLPMSIAPKEQYEIPFIVWKSNQSKDLKEIEDEISQNHVFHSVLRFLDIESPIYNEELNIFN